MFCSGNYRRFSTQGLLLLALLGLMIIMSFSSPYFMKWDNLRNILDQSTLNILVGVGMTMVICAGGIDLSVGAVAALAGAVMGLAMHAGYSAYLAIAAGLMVAVLSGLVNGGLTAYLRITPFIVTLASLSIIRGLTLIITGAIPISSFPSTFTGLGSGSLGIFPAPVVLTALVAAAGAVLLNLTPSGYYFQAMGGNEEALRRSGISVPRYKILVYVLSACCAGLAGLVLTARLNCADPTAGYMLEMDAIATAVLGGTSMRGGQGSMAGTVIAGLLLAVLRNGLTINSIASYYQQVLVGVIILAAVVISELRSKRVEEAAL